MRGRRKIPTISLQGTTLEQEAEETMKAQLKRYMSPSAVLADCASRLLPNDLSAPR